MPRQSQIDGGSSQIMISGKVHPHDLSVILSFPLSNLQKHTSSPRGEQPEVGERRLELAWEAELEPEAISELELEPVAELEQGPVSGNLKY